MLLPPRVERPVVMEAWENPSEEAKPWCPTPAVGIALASHKSGRLLRTVIQGKEEMAEKNGGDESSHVSEARLAC